MTTTMYRRPNFFSKLAQIKLIPKLIVLFIFLITVFNSSNWPIVQAQIEHGITITPTSQSIEITENQSSHRLAVIITNNTDTRVDVELNAQDFGALEEGGGLLFLGSEPNDKWDDHRIAKWIDIKPKKQKLDPQEQLEVIIEIANDHSLSPGGHYAAIIASINSKEEKSKLAINQSLSSLLFINKIGGESYILQAGDISPQSVWWGQVEGVGAHFANSGNAHLVPRGTITLLDPLNQTIAKGIVNQESTILLPGTETNFKTQLEQSNPPLWPGMYTLVLAYRYDGQDSVITTEQKVFSIGIVTTGVIILATAGVLAWLAKRSFSRLKSSD